ncbi:NADH-quinone oxidoreductase subunit NuoG [Parvularcula sp. LCG005]|uniref:NADH-quinone oxidoreductase subunit NuoG n=1 Tax=Parvularcula sp. LCG005 TaxID=3078805 RepID=UPI002941D24C|nr:NADH-quinone oxidoreductase subunit NuoG [Parvularcula sp. LCG005]WOI53828.1 NADH-quinone oxidoreductase subunit NuoG [Parvularcula sp. LCG005]
MTELRTIKVNGREIDVDPNLTLLQACEAAGEEIPRFCYHERLSIAGNCRMCLIEVKGGPPKPVASCAQNVKDLRPGPEGQPPEMFTNTPMVKKAREGVMEFLLINHPLDCPICDQGGECDLQDQAVAYGRGESRFEENKRAVEEKYMGPLIKTIMTRCIQCTRCVRFATEVAGVNDLGLVNRGENAEITTYLEKAVGSELTGNLIDVCPVGALTSKPYAFTARPWELRKTETIDVMDALGTNIRVDSRGREVLRILPRIHNDVNEEWLSDKGRFIWDGLKKRRLDRPYVRVNGKLQAASWSEAFAAIKARLDMTASDKIGALVGDLVPAEAIKALKDLTDALGTPHRDCRQDGSMMGVLPDGGEAPRSTYTFGSTVAAIDEADVILLVGTNPRVEAPVLNARIRRNFLDKMDLKIGLVGGAEDLTYGYTHLGSDPSAIGKLDSDFFQALLDAKKPMIIVGAAAFGGETGSAMMNAVLSLAGQVGAITPEWNGFNVLQTAASRVGALDLGFVPGAGGKSFHQILDAAETGDIEFVYNLGADECDTDKLSKAFVVYQGHHGDAGARTADVILPGAAYTEQSGMYVNTEGRVQLAQRAYFPFGEAREDWSILRALSGVLGKTLPYDDIFALRQAMMEDNSSFVSIGSVSPAMSPDAGVYQSGEGELPASFRPAFGNYYLANPIARASETMRACVEAYAPTARLAAE